MTFGTQGVHGFHAYGNVGHANITQGEKAPAKKGKWQEQRTCFVCGTKGHVAIDCPNRQTNEEDICKGPVVLSVQGTSFIANDDVLLLDYGATHHIVRHHSCLRNLLYSKITEIALGGVETHHVMGLGELLIHSPQTCHDVMFTNALYVPALAYNSCSGARLTSKGVTCLRVGTELVISSGKANLLIGSCVDNLYHKHCELIRSDHRRINSHQLFVVICK
jgi:hypothetical protein